jgi:HK97 family phage major capsid protein
VVSGSTDFAIVLGDFRQGYYVVDRMGLELMYNPLVVGANARPTGEVGWVAFWRTGGDCVNSSAFRMLHL